MNVGFFDRFIRLLIGIGFVIFDFLANANWEVIFMIFGLWGVLTSVFGWCPFYKLSGVNTCPTKIDHHDADEITV